MAFRAKVFVVTFCLWLGLVSSQDCGTSQYSNPGLCDREGVTCDDAPSPYIVGGIDARPNELPFQVALMWQGGFICGGFVWDPYHVITAQHCTESDPADTFQVIIGEHIRNEDDNPQRQTIQVAELIEHPDYDDYWLNDDIAILVLEEPVNINYAREPICFDQQYAGDNTFNMMSVASGWGSESDNGPSTQQLKYTSKLEIQEFESCRECDGFLEDEVKPGMICAGYCGVDNDENTCYGDSGGPLFVHDENQIMYVVGITSWGYGCRDPIPGVYVDMAYYEDWINASIGGASRK